MAIPTAVDVAAANTTPTTVWGETKDLFDKTFSLEAVKGLFNQVFTLKELEKPVSAFVFAEFAMVNVSEAQDRIFELKTHNLQEKCQKITKIVITTLFGTFIAFPLATLLLPLTIITDIAIGIIGSIYLAYKGEHSKWVIAEFAYQKIIDSPIEQLVLAVLKYSIPVLIYFLA